MSKRLLMLLVAASFALAVGAALASASSDPLPSGERIVGGSGAHGGTVVEPVYDDMTGAIRYVSTPRGTPDPVKSNPIAAAPFYLPVYPVGSSVPTLNCQDVPAENCPDHGGPVAGAAQAIMPAVYGGGVIGHDHLMAGPGSHGDFNVAWVPTLVLFTTKGCSAQNPQCNVAHITLDSQVDAMAAAGTVLLVALDGSNGTPNLTFHCSVVPAAVYATGSPFLG